MSKTATIKFVSLGPGDAELITLRGFRALEAADYVYCPGTEAKGKIFSRSKSLLEELNIDNGKLRVFAVPMKEDGVAAKRVYTEIANEIIQKSKQNCQIAVVANGHNGLYSSGFYISELVGKAGISTELIAGIPAFIGAGALASLHIAKENEALIILPKVESANQINNYISDGCQIAIMKPSKSESIIKSAIQEFKNLDVHYFENVGIKGKEFYCSDKKEILERKFPYFSLLILKH